MRNNLFIIFLLGICACTNYQSTSKKSVDDFSISPISIFNIRANFIGKTYIIIGHSKSIPGTPIKKIKDFIYEINLSVKVNGINTYWSSPFKVVLILPNGGIKYQDLNEEGYSFSSNFIEDFRFVVEIPNKGMAKCALSLTNQHRGEFRLTDYDWWYLDLN
jgi:hypothetical protein